MSCNIGTGSGTKAVNDIKVGISTSATKDVSVVKRWDGTILWQRNNSSGMFVGVRTSDNTIYTSSDGLTWNNKAVSGYGNISSCCLLGDKIYFLSLKSSAAYLYSIKSDLSGSITQVKAFGTATKTGCVIPGGTKVLVSMRNGETYSTMIYDTSTGATTNIDLSASLVIEDGKALFTQGVATENVILAYSGDFSSSSSAIENCVGVFSWDGLVKGIEFHDNNGFVRPSLCNGKALITFDQEFEGDADFIIKEITEDFQTINYTFNPSSQSVLAKQPDGSRLCFLNGNYSILLKHSNKSLLSVGSYCNYETELTASVASCSGESSPFSQVRNSIVSNGTVLLASNNGYMEYTLDGVTYVATSIPTIDVLEYYAAS